MSNLHAPGLTPQQRQPHSIDDHDRPASASMCWRCHPELVATVTDVWADDDDLERLLEGLREL